ncbi:MAG: hypothetical protein ACRDQX_05395 [Pseudonocardiaceae bacterium]
MDRQAVLAAFDEQLRRHPALDGHVEHDEGVIRSMSACGGWTGVAWCDLDHVNADVVIAAQISRFAERSRPWAWKHYSYDQPPDLPDRLLAAGFTPQSAEALLVAEIALGFRYLQVDASSASRPIFQRLGFVELANTTPFTHPGGAS